MTEDLEIVEEGFEVWARLDQDNNIIEINSNIFIKDFNGWTKIDEHVIGDKGAHAQNSYLDKPLINDNGIYQYKYIDNKIIEISEEELQEQIQEQEKLTYPQLVESMIRQKYSVSDELAILRQRDTKPEEFTEYNDFCEQCKSIAKAQLKI